MVSVDGLRIVRLIVPAGTAGGYHDLASLFADQAGRDNRVFRTDILPREAAAAVARCER